MIKINFESDLNQDGIFLKVIPKDPFGIKIIRLLLNIRKKAANSRI
jgi:hypothetical protein